MPKLFWVGLPLLIAAALVVALWLRRRTPSRPLLNAGSSLLLMAYLLTTAGLGLFWVANQQLPVFDWHYLFGYATLLLVALHLSFNLRTAWRALVRPRPAPVSAPAAVSVNATRRRGALAGIAALAATGIAFALGLRIGRGRSDTDRLAAGQAERGAPSSPGAWSGPASPLAIVERFHARSAHARSALLLRPPDLAWREAPASFKRLPAARRLALPAAGARSSAAVDLAGIAALLWHTAGVTETRGGLQLRASPSSGALFSTELYLLARDLAALPRGVWHYEADAHALATLGAAPPDGDVFGIGDAPALVVATAVFGRTGHKYRDRAYRYVLADLGHALENLCRAAAACGLVARPSAQFDEARFAALLGVDQADEGVLALVALHPAANAPPAVGPAASAGSAPRLVVPAASAGSARWLVAPATSAGSAPESVAAASDSAPSPRLPGGPGFDGSPRDVTAAIHAATSWHGSGAPSVPVAVEPGAATAPAIALPPIAPVAVDVLAVIAARRSQRRFAPGPLGFDALAGVLAALPDPAALPLSTALRIDVVALAVASLPPGAYRYDPSRHALLLRRAGASREAARAAALDQDVVGDAAVAIVLSLDHDALAADPLGPARAYRHAFLEAGRIGERVYLAAGARGLAACGVGAFYDDEASALVGGDPAREWVLHFAALGVAAL